MNIEILAIKTNFSVNGDDYIVCMTMGMVCENNQYDKHAHENDTYAATNDKTIRTNE